LENRVAVKILAQDVLPLPGSPNKIIDLGELLGFLHILFNTFTENCDPTTFLNASG